MIRKILETLFGKTEYGTNKMELEWEVYLQEYGA